MNKLTVPTPFRLRRLRQSRATIASGASPSQRLSIEIGQAFGATPATMTPLLTADVVDGLTLFVQAVNSISALAHQREDLGGVMLRPEPEAQGPVQANTASVKDIVRQALLDYERALRFHSAIEGVVLVGTPAQPLAAGTSAPAVNAPGLQRAASVSTPTRAAAGSADAVVERTPIRLHDPVQERLRQRAATAVLNGTEWLTSAQVDALAPGADKRSNAHARANRLLGEGRVFAIEHGGRKHYPRYAFDALGTPYEAVREVLQAFGDATPLRVASWFESTSAALDGRRPRELLDSDPSAVVRAAREHVVGPLHG